MNRNDFLGLIGRDNPVDRQVLAELGELITIFPYFQTAHLLLLKGLKDNQDIRFDNQLKISAIHIADREVLYNLLKITPEAGIAEKEPVREPDIMPVVTEQEHQAEAGPVLSGTAEIQPPEPIIPESGTSEPQPVFREQEDNLVPETSEMQVDLEQTVLDSAKNSEDLNSEIEKMSSEMQEGKNEENDDYLTGRPILISDDIDNEVSVPGVLLINEEPTDEGERIFYMDPGFSVPENESEPVQDHGPLPVEPLQKEAEETGEAPEPQAPVQKTAEAVTKTVARKTQTDLIDKFISENPRIEPRREKTDQPVEDLANPFTEEKGGFMTETLARIYIAQGYYSKAIDIYEKLSLKFPEKSGYFATQIEKIKDILK